MRATAVEREERFASISTVFLYTDLELRVRCIITTRQRGEDDWPKFSVVARLRFGRSRLARRPLRRPYGTTRRLTLFIRFEWIGRIVRDLNEKQQHVPACLQAGQEP